LDKKSEPNFYSAFFYITSLIKLKVKNIITITLNPAIDKSTSVFEMLPEKKLICTNPKFDAGGGGINVARAIKHLGGEAIALYFSGGYTGNFLNDLLNNEKINCKFIPCKNAIRENLIVFDEKMNLQYRFGMPGPKIEESEWQLLFNTLNEFSEVEFIVVSGSVPPGFPLNTFNIIAQIAKEKKAKLIIDTSGDALKKWIDEGVYLIKANLNELCSLSGMKNIIHEDIPLICKSIIEKGKCELMVISLGAKGAWLISNAQNIFISAPEVNVISTVGAGDSMLAGIIWSLYNKKDLTESLKYGVACGSAATMNAGTSLCNKEDVKYLLKKMS
jgi:6-phosphofructokinase 2